MDTSIGTPVEVVARTYMLALDDLMTGQVIDAIQ